MHISAKLLFPPFLYIYFVRVIGFIGITVEVNDLRHLHATYKCWCY